jgi:ADP-heptose:LPS heptosyltransferase
MALPALLGIRRAYPKVKMRLFTTNAVKPFAETLGLFDAILVLNDKNIFAFFASGFRCLFACFGNDTVIDLEIYSCLSTVLSLLTCARNRIGFFFEEAGFRQVLHTHRIFFHPASALYRHYDRIAALMGAPLVSMQDCGAHVRAVIGAPEANVKRGAGLVAVGCGCSDLSHERKLAPELWARHVFAKAADKEREVVFLGAKGDKNESEKVMSAVRALGANGWLGPLKNSCGTMTLVESLRILAGSEEFWGIESSLLHYARLFGIRLRAFLGPTHPIRLRPVPGLAEEIHYRKTLCSPCIHQVSVPPCHGNNLCMRWLFETAPEDRDGESWIPVVTDQPLCKRS